MPGRGLKRWDGRSGFTMVELLIALTIFATVAIALYTAFSLGVSVWRRTESGIDLHQDVRVKLERVAKDLRGAVVYSGIPFEGEQSRLVFASVVMHSDPEAEKRYPQICKIVYSVETDEESKSLLTRVVAGKESGFDEESTLAKRNPFFGNVEEFSIKYAYAGEEVTEHDWRDSWEGEGMPRGIEITLSLQDPTEEKSKLDFKKKIFIPIGVLGESE